VRLGHLGGGSRPFFAEILDCHFKHGDHRIFDEALEIPRVNAGPATDLRTLLTIRLREKRFAVVVPSAARSVFLRHLRAPSARKCSRNVIELDISIGDVLTPSGEAGRRRKLLSSTTLRPLGPSVNIHAIGQGFFVDTGNIFSRASTEKRTRSSHFQVTPLQSDDAEEN